MDRLEAIKTASDIQATYSTLIGAYVAPAFLLMGLAGSGKTSTALTGRTPILIDMFDTKGYILMHSNPKYKQMMAEGNLFVRLYTKEDSKKPTEYKKWADQWEKDCKTGFLNFFGTYVIDSGTTWLEAMSNYIMAQKKRVENLAIQDYTPIYNTVVDTIKISCSQGCDFIYIAHTVTVKDEITEEIVTELDTYNRLKSKIPKLFSEKYHCVTSRVPTGVKYELLTSSAGRYTASTQLQNLNQKEEPNIKSLLEKAQLESKNKPPLVLEVKK
jgi:hypothetical protein